jgi:2-polyprenyl-3-methyl-5-hydroxy-6-metoxy-1,4-benzoquinol methylase
MENLENQKKFYNQVFREEHVWSDADFSLGNKFFIQRFIDSVSKPNVKKVLEIGCGNGLLTFFLLKKPMEITAIDISGKAIENMEKQFQKEIGTGKLKLKCQDIIEFLKNTEEKFDLIIGSGIIHHIPKDQWKELFFLSRERLNENGIFSCAPEPNAGGLYFFFWKTAKFFYRLFGIDYDWEVEKGTLDMKPKRLRNFLKKAGFKNSKISPFQVIPHFHLRLLEFIDRKIIGKFKGKLAMYIIIKGEKDNYV